MEIRAGVRYDYKACRAMAHAYSYKRKNPMRTMLLHICLAFLLGALAAYTARLSGEWTPYILVFGICILMVALELITYFLLPRLQYNSMSKMKDISNLYVFRDEDVTATTDSEEYRGETVISYTLLDRVMETKDYFLLFENKRQAFLVDKATLEGNDTEKLREKLKAVLGKRYISCRY